MEHRPGTVRWMDPERPGEWRHCAPGAPFYSTALFLAEEIWNEASQSWRPIYTEGDDDGSLELQK